VFTTFNELGKEFFSCVSLCHELLVEEAEPDEISEEQNKGGKGGYKVSQKSQ
jgi:hypothetical protein